MPPGSRSADPSSLDGRLSREQRRQYVLLGLPSLGLSLAVTTLATYVPVLARGLTESQTVIGALVGAEGFVALLLPVWVGTVSDRVATRLGPRMPFMLVTAPVAALSLALLPLGRSLPWMALEVVVFYLAYFTYNAPYAALYSDLVCRAAGGRAQGIQGVCRATGMGSALVGGALLMQWWVPLPYVVAAAALLVTTLVAVVGLRSATSPAVLVQTAEPQPARTWSLLRAHRDVRRFLIVNVLWQLAVGGLKSFIVLYLTRGLNKSLSFCAGAMAVVACAAVVGAPLAGLLADRYGPVKVMRILLAAFGVGLWTPVFSRSVSTLLAVLPVVGMGGAMALSLPYAILMRRMPPSSHGAVAGLFDVSGGAGSLLGPLITGAFIDLLHPVFKATNGYGAMWPVLGTTILLSIPLLHPRTDAGARLGAP